MDEFAMTGSLLNSETQQIRSEFAYLFDTSYNDSSTEECTESKVAYSWVSQQLLGAITSFSKAQYEYENRLLKTIKCTMNMIKK
jgi:hypothetical protein